MDCIPLGCFGKLPFYKEYIHDHIDEPEAQLLVRWMDEGTEYCNNNAARVRDACNTRYHIVFCPQAGHNFLTGHLRISSDSLRNYPFVLFGLCSYQDFRGRFSLLPHLLLRFWERLNHFLAEEFTNLQTFQERMRTLCIPVPCDQPGDREALLSMTISTNANVLWNALFNSADDPRKFHVFQNLWTVLSPHRTNCHGALHAAVRLPLSSGIISPVAQVFFWLEVISRMLKTIDITPSLFIPHLQEDGGVTHFYVFFREPRPTDYRDIMQPSGSSETINDLCGAWDFLERKSTVPLKVEKLLQSQEATLQQIIDSCGAE